MKKESIFNAVKEAIVEILPDIEVHEVQPEMSLKDIGANSVDRMDIIIRTMELTDIKVPLVEFGKLSNIQGIIDLLDAKK
ncbi:acyl carrier protein [Paenibacillus popilliae]|uniref:Acyl carrier protein n=1 Tax=Paenibacillus popilliae TaxID=78057 RepID=A0ABY3AVZ9_PAEPP|nr:acyl carrier protein [Paenibacillus sp. SDF0028]TQR46690.1 acyl carrier protein [Paenibacillus sp. SDF0028]